VLVWVWVVLTSVARAQAPAAIVVRVESEGHPVPNAIVTAGNQKAETHAEGPCTLSVTPGVATLTATKVGFVDLNQAVTVLVSGVKVTIELVAVPYLEEEVVVVAPTRTGRRAEDQPTRVEVPGREEIEGKMLMTPVTSHNVERDHNEFTCPLRTVQQIVQ
jgi:iron complex outermembrane receptor protein